MTTKFRINVTKEILEKSKNCTLISPALKKEGVGNNCAVALGIANLFPDVWVTTDSIRFINDWEKFSKAGPILLISKSKELVDGEIGIAELPSEASEFIRVFDNTSPENRINLPELSFEIEVDDEIISKIVDISEISSILKDCKTLELV